MKNTKKMLTVGSIATCGVLVGSVMLPTTASANGTSDAVITCDSAYAYDPENYQHPGFVCEVDPDSVTVDGEVFSVVKYKIVVRDGKQGVIESKDYPYGLDPEAIFLSYKPFGFDKTYDVDYKATLDNGEGVLVKNDDFELDTPARSGKPNPKLSYGTLKDGIGKGYKVHWGKNARTDGYEVQTKNKGGKWAPVELAGARRAEIGRIPKAKPGTFKVRVRSWNAAGYSDWNKRSN